ncbi:D-lactate ferricytochrome c oxidoreductase [Cryptotrichosporon argae]
MPPRIPPTRLSRARCAPSVRLASTARRPPPPPPSAPARYPTAPLAIGLVFGSAVLGYLGATALASAPDPKQQLSTLLPSSYALPLQKAHQPSYGTPADYRSAIAELRALYGARGKSDRVSTDEADLDTHGLSDWSYHDAKPPTVVVWADTTEEVQDVVKIARKWRVPITPFSGGTSLEGHFSSPYGGISLDVSSMDRVLSVSEADGSAVVQAGVKWEDLNAHLAAQGIPLFIPLDPGPGATIGGMVGTGCSGTNAVRYGTAKAEWFLNLTVVLPTGEIIKTRSSARKSSAGWDATKLFIGAEGTLGIVTEATVRLAPLLPTKCAVVTFPGVEEAVAAATAVVNKGFPVQCVEYLDGRTIHAINNGGQVSRKYKETDTLFFKFQGSDASMAEVSKGVAALVKQYGGANFEFSKSDKEAADLWAGRKAALWSVIALREGAKVWTTDVCVPIGKLPTLVKETSDDFERRGLEACHFGHVGDGNVHSLALFSDDAELARVRVAVHDMVERAIRLGGTCTGEHGVGIGKVEYLDQELGEGTVNLMETVKRAVDPLNLFNPGKIYPHIKPAASK